MKIRIALLSMLVWVSPVSAAAQALAPSSIQIVESLHAKLLDAMMRSDDLGYDGRYALLRPALDDYYDLDFMAEKTVGRHWRQLGEADQALWRDAFRSMMAANYADRFVGYTGQSFETHGEEPFAHQTVLVRTTLLNPEGDDVQLHYRLRQTDAGWRIVDIYLNGTVSELALRRSEYGSVLKRGGFETLLTSVVEKAQELASVGAAADN